MADPALIPPTSICLYTPNDEEGSARKCVVREITDGPTRSADITVFDNDGSTYAAYAVPGVDGTQVPTQSTPRWEAV